MVSFFLKKINKDKAVVEFTSSDLLSLDLPTTDTPPKRYNQKIELFGPIDTKASSFKIMGTKLELTLVKADGASWPVLKKGENHSGEIIQVGKAGRAWNQSRSQIKAQHVAPKRSNTSQRHIRSISIISANNKLRAIRTLVFVVVRSSFITSSFMCVQRTENRESGNMIYSPEPP